MDPVAAALQIRFNYYWLLRVLGRACGVDVWPGVGSVHCGCLRHGGYMAGHGQLLCCHLFSLCCSRPWGNEVLVARARSLLDEKVAPSPVCVIYDQREVSVSSLRAVGASACGYWCLRNWFKSSPSC